MLLTHAPPFFSSCRPLDGLQRWQMFMILITLIISQLLVNIWMFYAKVRALAHQFLAALFIR